MTAKLVFIGDFCATDGLLPILSGSFKKIIKTSDLVSINLEAPVVSSSNESVTKIGPVLGQPKSALTALKNLGVNVFCLSNNHIMDFGERGLQSTFDAIKDDLAIGAGFSFESAYEPKIVVLNGLRVALLAFSEAQFGVLLEKKIDNNVGYAWIDHPKARKNVSIARNIADVVIVQVHAGLEMVSLPLPEWRERYRELIDLGADLVIGHHPHVIQGSEIYKGKMIFYSIGNFYLDTMTSGSGGIVNVELTGDKIFSSFIPLKRDDRIIDIDQSEKAFKVYSNLCDQLIDDSLFASEINRICRNCWHEIYSGYYEQCLNGLGVDPNIKKGLQLSLRILKRMKRSAEMNNTIAKLMLVHNIRIESHRWVVDRALRNLCGHS